MAHQPLLPRDAPGPNRPTVPLPEDNLEEDGAYPSLAKLAHALSKHVDSAVSAELALDLVLNEIVDQARLATVATGAAVALVRDEELVCRATTGANAPELGVRLNTHQGLSGACFQSRQVQLCVDTENDPRVDPEDCRHLGLRSILVVPVLDHADLLGVVEIFSPLAHAFGERDVQTLQALSRRIVESVGRAAEAANPPPPAPVPEPPPVRMAAPEIVPLPLAVAPRKEKEVDVAVPTFGQTAAAPPRDWLTAILTALVVALAVILGWMVGTAGWRRARALSHKAAPPAVHSQSPSTSNPATVIPAIVDPTPPGAAAQVPKTGSGAVTNGGLVVYEQGKVVFQMQPASGHVALHPASIPPEVASSYVLERIEPQYPDPAREQRIQGAVVLTALVGTDGVVQELKVVSGDPQLVSAAAEAVKQWRFRPYRPAGKPTEFETRVTVDFRLPKVD